MNDEILDSNIASLESSSLSINVKIRTLDNEFMVNINSQNRVEELKKRIENISKVPYNRQRLIFRGRLLKDMDPLSSYKITDLDVVHLVAKTAEQVENSISNEENTMNSESSNTRRRDTSIFNLMNRLIRPEYDNNEASGVNLGSGPSGSTGNSSRVIPGLLGRRSRRTGVRDENNSSRNSDFNSIECRESIFQNLATMNNLIECSSPIELQQIFSQNSNSNTLSGSANEELLDKRNKNKTFCSDIIIKEEENSSIIDDRGLTENSNIQPTINCNNNISSTSHNEQETSLPSQSQSDSKEMSNSYSINLFNFKKRKLFKGQWIDVKDTIEQWLEAQVIDVKDNRVYVHYNGWGTRWDEWLDMESDRIKPFRFHTRQTNYSHYQSPFPVIKPDANVSLESNFPSQGNFFEIFDEVDKQYNNAKNLMDKIKSCRSSDVNESSKQKDVFTLSKNLVPFFDRMGRTMSDIGAYIHFSMRSNKLEDLDKKLFDSQTLDPELKPLDRTEQSQVDSEESARRSSRESGMNIITPINRIERLMNNQVPLLDSSLNIYNQRLNNSTPLVDIYVHTIITPVNNRNSSTNNTNPSNGTNLNSTTENLINPQPHPQAQTQQPNINTGSSPSSSNVSSTTNFLNLLTNSRHANNIGISNLSENLSSNTNLQQQQSNNIEDSNSNFWRSESNQNNQNNENIEKNEKTEENQTLLGNKRPGQDLQNERMESHGNRVNINNNDRVNFDNFLNEPQSLNNTGGQDEFRSLSIEINSDMENIIQNQEISGRDQINLNRNRINSDDASSYEIIVEEFYENENEVEEDESNLDEI